LIELAGVLLGLQEPMTALTAPVAGGQPGLQAFVFSAVWA
jgi:hypothetical protein